MELVPNDDSYNYRYLEVAHQTGYCQLYELVQNAAKQLKLRWAEAWATLMRGEEITLGNSIFRLQK